MGRSTKKLDFKVLSDKVCSVKGCNNKLKQRIVDHTPTADKCFKCHMKLIRKNPRYNGKNNPEVGHGK